MINSEINTENIAGITIYPFSHNLRSYLRHADYHVETLGGSQPSFLMVHGMNKLCATEEAALNGLNEFMVVDCNEEIELIRL